MVPRKVRYLILLLILLFVAVNEALIQLRTTSWEQSLWVKIYAVNGDGRAATQAYIDRLDASRFQPIEDFVNREARRYGITIDAIEVEYGGQIDAHPPKPPAGDSILENVWWSLRFRAWAWRRAWGGDDGDIELFVSYFDTATTQSLRHSVGLQGGLIGIIYAFADPEYRGSNQVVITHELMHTLGAKDKYGPNNLPQLPQGYADPGQVPLYPQRKAEIMGGRIPLSPTQARMPVSLREVAIGLHTAAEIHWPIGAE